MTYFGVIFGSIVFVCQKKVKTFFFYFLATDLKVDGGYGAMSAEGHGEKSSFAGVDAAMADV